MCCLKKLALHIFAKILADLCPVEVRWVGHCPFTAGAAVAVWQVIKHCHWEGC